VENFLTSFLRKTPHHRVSYYIYMYKNFICQVTMSHTFQPRFRPNEAYYSKKGKDIQFKKTSI